MADEVYLSIEEVAKRLGVEEKTVGKYVRGGRLKAIKNPVNSSIVGFTEANIQEFLFPTGKPVEIKEKTKGDAELEGIGRDIALLKAKNELELAKRGFDSFEKYDKACADLVTQKTKLEAIEQAVKEQEQTNAILSKVLADRESKVALAEEERRSLLVQARQRIAQVDENHRKARELDDKRRQQTYSKGLSTMDNLAHAIYNAPLQEISNRVREKMIEFLEPLMVVFGMKPQFDKQGGYIPLLAVFGLDLETERAHTAMPSGDTIIGLEVDTEGREPLYVPSNADMPENIRKSYKICVTIYQFLYKERLYGREYCRQVYESLKELQGLVKNQVDADINANMDRILALLRKNHHDIMAIAEVYQDGQRGDWSDYVNYLCEQAIRLEGLLSII